MLPCSRRTTRLKFKTNAPGGNGGLGFRPRSKGVEVEKTMVDRME